MKLLLSAPFHAPRFEGTQIAAAARRMGVEVVEFAHPESRDPTLELPEAARRARPDFLLLVQPDREDPATLDLVRRFGATVLMWEAPLPPGAPAFKRARRAWLARAADAAFATHSALAATRFDRLGRPARVAPAGFDLETLRTGDARAARAGAGSVGGAGGDAIALPPGVAIAVRAADDPLQLAPETGADEFSGWGEKSAFPGLSFSGRLATPKDFSELVGGRRYIAGGRVSDLPAVFDDAAAALACGARVIDVGLRQKIGDGTERSASDASLGGFANALRTILDAASRVRTEGGDV